MYATTAAIAVPVLGRQGGHLGRKTLHVDRQTEAGAAADQRGLVELGSSWQVQHALTVPQRPLRCDGIAQTMYFYYTFGGLLSANYNTSRQMVSQSVKHSAFSLIFKQKARKRRRVNRRRRS